MLNVENSQVKKVSVNIVVYNGQNLIRPCLESVFAQDYPNFEVNILDNASIDETLKIIKLGIGDWELGILNFSLVESKKNLGMWPGQEKLLELSSGELVVILSVDVLMKGNFISEAVKIFEDDAKIGAIQPLVFKLNGSIKTDTVDTLGFEIFKSRKVVNVGHGQEEAVFAKSYGEPKEVFAVEGAVPIFRKQALEDCRLKSQGNKIIDPDFFWYGDDLDIAWRIRLLGWKQVYGPTVVAWHDRKTTKSLAGGNWREFIKIRKTVPLFKRKLDWRNTIFAIIKNDLTANLLADLPYILWRQFKLWCYFLIFETSMVLEIFKVAKMVPKMLKRREEIMKKKKITAKEMAKWFR